MQTVRAVIMMKNFKILNKNMIPVLLILTHKDKINIIMEVKRHIDIIIRIVIIEDIMIQRFKNIQNFEYKAKTKCTYIKNKYSTSFANSSNKIWIKQ